MKKIVIAIILLFSMQVSAHHIEQDIRVLFDARGCVIGTELLSPTNCPSTDNPCKNKKDCICAGEGTKIKWKAGASEPFELLFSNNPLESSCRVKSKKDGSEQKVKCKVKNNVAEGDYKYDIKATPEHCAIYDPHIIIRPM